MQVRSTVHQTELRVQTPEGQTVQRSEPDGANERHDADDADDATRHEAKATFRGQTQAARSLFQPRRVIVQLLKMIPQITT